MVRWSAAADNGLAVERYEVEAAAVGADGERKAADEAMAAAGQGFAVVFNGARACGKARR